MKKVLIVLLLVLHAISCKSTQVSSKNEQTVDDKILNSILAEWESNNSLYLEDLKHSVNDDKESKQINGVLDYVKRASIGYGQYEPRRKNFLRHLFLKYDLDGKDFIIAENFQGERILYILIIRNQKLTFQSVVEDWELINKVDLNFDNVESEVKAFERNADCPISTFSYSLITMFQSGKISSLLDDKSCKSLNI